MSITDVGGEAVAAMLARPIRAALTTLGTVLGVAAFVAVLGLTSTASSQISKSFTALSATEVTVTDQSTDIGADGFPFPTDVEQRLGSLNGVVAAGQSWQVQTTGASGVSARPPYTTHTSANDSVNAEITAASTGFLTAIHAHVTTGRLYDTWHQSHATDVCLLGSAAAQKLGITRVSDQPAIFIGSTALTVIGIIDSTERQPQILSSVVIPSTTAVRLWGAPDPQKGESGQVLIETRLGAAQLIASQAALAIRPDQPHRFQISAPADPHQLRDQVNTALAGLFLTLAGICLVIGAVGITNTTLVSVLERTSEIGLRRALGARGRHIAAQFLSESAFLGLLGGMIGTSLGIATVVGISLAQQWTPVLEPATIIPTPLLGATIGLVAGIYPAWRATRTEPVDALRR
jgi:putative ABC transport system permease protein